VRSIVDTLLTGARRCNTTSLQMRIAVRFSDDPPAGIGGVPCENATLHDKLNAITNATGTKRRIDANLLAGPRD